MGASKGGYRCRVADIRNAQQDDLDAIFDSCRRGAEPRSGSPRSCASTSRHALTPANGTDRWVALDEEQIVGYAALDSSQDLVHAAVDPDVGDALLARAAARGAERGFTHLSITTVPEDRPLSALVERHGFVHDRDILRMWRVLDGDAAEAPWPEGLTVRSYVDADGERVHALLDRSYSAWDTSYAPLPHDEWLAFMTDTRSSTPRCGSSSSAGRRARRVRAALEGATAERLGEGHRRCDERTRARARQRAAAHAFHAYAKRGVERVGLKVDSSNPTGALQLYDSVGFVTDRRYGIWMRAL